MNNPYLSDFFSREQSRENEKVKLKLRKIDETYPFDHARVQTIFKFVEDNVCLEDGRPFKLISYHKMLLSIIYGYTGYHLRELSIVVGRSNAKSVFAVILLVIETFFNPSPFSSCRLMSVSRDKSCETLLNHFKIVCTNEGSFFYKLYRNNEIKILNDKVKINATSRLKCRGSEIKVSSNRDDTLDGGREKLVVVDELAAYDNSPLSTLRGGLEKNNGMLFICTTNNIKRGKAYDEETQLMKKVNSDLEILDALYFFYQLDDISDVKNEEKWYLANPALGVTVTVEAIRRAVMETMMNPVKLSNVFTKRFNLSLNDSTHFFLEHDVERTACDMDEKIRGKYVIMGADFSLVEDSVGISLLWFEHNQGYLYPLCFRPSHKRISGKYDNYQEIYYHDGERNDSEELVSMLMAKLDELQVKVFAIAYDKAYCLNFLRLFDTMGLMFEHQMHINQGSFSISQHIVSFKESLRTKQIIYNSELLRQHLLNAKVKFKDTSILRLIKPSLAEKIDLVDASVNALAFCEKEIDLCQQYWMENEII